MAEVLIVEDDHSSLDALRYLVEDEGFEVTTEEEFSDTVPKGRVISQSPNSGTGFRGDLITLVVSKGPELITIPQVKGHTTGAAKAELEALGFKVKVKKSFLYVGAGYVVGVSPGEGAAVPKGSTVELSVV